MPIFYINAINSKFQTRDEGKEYSQADDALRQGIQAALAIGVDEIHEGRSSAAVEVCVEDGDERTLLRSVVSISVSSLQLHGDAARPSR